MGHACRLAIAAAVPRIFNTPMRTPAIFSRVLAVAALLAALSVPLLCGGSYSDLHFFVVKDENGKPVRNASVILHEVHKNGKQASGGLQLKTDSEGEANYDAVPYGKLRVQVIAKGYQTFGQDYDINQPKHDIVIKLKAPADQVTIYK